MNVYAFRRTTEPDEPAPALPACALTDSECYVCAVSSLISAHGHLSREDMAAARIDPEIAVKYLKSVAVDVQERRDDWAIWGVDVAPLLAKLKAISPTTAACAAFVRITFNLVNAAGVLYARGGEMDGE